MNSRKSNILSINSFENSNLEKENKQKESSDRGTVKTENNEIVLTIKEINEDEDEPDKNDNVDRNKKSKNIDQNILYDEEEEALLKYKKNTLEDKFEDLNNKFKGKGDIKIYDIIKKKSESENKNEINENIKKEMKRILDNLSCKIYTYALLFLTLYLIGIFQLLDLFDSTKKETGIIFKSFFFDKLKEGNETFKELYINSCFKNIPEFDFAFVTSFIGSFPLKFCGFFISSLIFTILNSFLFINFSKLDFEKQKYDFFDFFHIAIYFLLFFISFGAISLFPHEKISEGIIDYENKRILYSEKNEEKSENDEKKEEEIKEQVVQEIQEDKKEKEGEENRKEKKEEKLILRPKYEMQTKLFMIIGIGIIFAYILNKLINYLFYRYSSKFFEENFELIFIIIYDGSYIISLIFYLFFHYQLIVIKELENTEEKEEKIKSKYYRICGFLIYYEKELIDSSKINKNKLKVHGLRKRNINLNEDSKQNRNENSVVNKEINNININCRDIFCSIIIPCYKNCKKEDKNSKYCCASCKLGFRKFFYRSQEKNRILLNIFKHCTCCICEECCGCCPKCQKCCCECCSKFPLDEFYEEEEIFCYVYQSQRKCSWFCDLFFNKNILSLIIANILIEICIIGTEKKINENLEIRTVTENFKTLGVYLAIFFILIFIYTRSCFILLKYDYNFHTKLIFGIYSYNIIISGFSSFGKKKLKNVADDWLLLIPLSWAKYINFLVLDKLVGVLDEENIDILSNSFIMTCIFFIYDIIVFIVSDLFDIASDTLILFQFIIGLFIYFFLLFQLIFFLINNNNFLFNNFKNMFH